MKFILFCCVFMVTVFYLAQAQSEKIVAANQDAQSRSEGGLIVDGVIAAEQNSQSRSNEQIRLIPVGILPADGSAQNRAGQSKLQQVVQN